MTKYEKDDSLSHKISIKTPNFNANKGLHLQLQMFLLLDFVCVFMG